MVYKTTVQLWDCSDEIVELQSAERVSAIRFRVVSRTAWVFLRSAVDTRFVYQRGDTGEFYRTFLFRFEQGAGQRAHASRLTSAHVTQRSLLVLSLMDDEPWSMKAVKNDAGQGSALETAGGRRYVTNCTCKVQQPAGEYCSSCRSFDDNGPNTNTPVRTPNTETNIEYFQHNVNKILT